MSQTTTIQNDVVVLPERLREAWRDASVYITGEKDTIVIKRLRAPQFSSMLDAMNEVGKNIPLSTLNDALKSVRDKA